MPLPETEISAIHYKIKRRQIELENLAKYRKLKTQRKLLGLHENEDLDQQEATILRDIKGLQGEIRRIENRELRKGNLS